MAIILLTGCDSLCSDNIMETIPSPDGEHKIKTYLRNCGATCDFEVWAEVCDKNEKCKKIYYAYHESLSFVYWIDNENVFINQKNLNIFKDKYKCYNCSDSQFRLHSNLSSKDIYLVDKEKNEYKFSGGEVYYIEEYGESVFNFNKKNIYTDYDFMMKVITIAENATAEYFLKIDDNKMHIINGNKMSELNRTDYEYIKKILITNSLYKFD